MLDTKSSTTAKKHGSFGLAALGSLIVQRAGLMRRPELPGKLLQTLEVQPSSKEQTSGSGRKKLIFALALSPTFLAILYYGFTASDRYVAEAKFIVKTAAKSNDSGGLGSFLKFAGSMTGMTRSQDDTYSVQEFIKSRAAVEQLKVRIPLAEIYNRPGSDFIARYPSVIFGKTDEELFSYLQWMWSLNYSNTTGVATMRVQAFRPEDAALVANSLLDLGEEVVNRLNARINSDAIKNAVEEVTMHERRLVNAQLALTDFRNRELMVDAAQSSVIITELIARLDAERIVTQAQISQIQISAPDSPQTKFMNGRVAAINDQIAEQRAKISEPSTGIALKLAEFERLSLEREFAKLSLAGANTALDNARTEARRQQLYLERIVEPNLPDYPTAPQALRMSATVLGANVLLLLVIWLFYMGITEHGAGQS